MKRLFICILVIIIAISLISCGQNNKNESDSAEQKKAKQSSKPITIIAPANPGGGYDSLARAIAAMGPEYLDRMIIVKNVSGASFTLGTAEAIKSEPDGNTFVLCTNKQFSTTPHAMDVEYDPITEVQYLSSMAEVRWVWAVNGSLFESIGASDTTEFLDYVKSNPGVLKGGVISTTTSLMFDLLADSGYEFRITSYADAASLSIAIANGEVDCGFATPAAVLPLHESGDIEFAMEISSISGESFMEGVPSATDDFPDIVNILGSSYIQWYGLFGPKGIDQEVIDEINKFIHDISEDDGFNSLVSKIGILPNYHTAEEMENAVLSEYELVDEYFKNLTQ